MIGNCRFANSFRFSQNETVESADGRTPKEIINLDDEETPKANIDAEDKNKKVSPIPFVVVMLERKEENMEEQL